MSTGKQHLSEFRSFSKLLNDSLRRVKEAIDEDGCYEGLAVLYQSAGFLGCLDAQYDASPEGHPVRKALIKQMKKGKAELDQATRLFERRCARKGGGGRR